MSADELKRELEALRRENVELRAELRTSQANEDRLGRQNSDLTDLNFELERELSALRSSKAA